MDADPSTHPTAETLQAYGLGNLDDGSAEGVSKHLEDCLDCRRRVAEITAVSSAVRPLSPIGMTADDPGLDLSSSPRMSSTGQVAPMSVALHGPDDASLQPGTRVGYFGDYELLKVLGEGGMGIVYKARQLSLNRSVALKMVKTSRFPSTDELRRFQNESEAVARLDHPNIVPVFEVGRYEDQHYFSMKLIAGESLDKKSKDYLADPRRAAELVATTAGAIHHAHQRGVLHRDLKPANILIDSEGQPHVTDFGLAKRVEGDSELTRSGAILGTPAYMAPEQASGKRGTVTTSTDVYGLGAVLYVLLTGRAPFGGDSVIATLEQVRERAPEPPRKRNPRVPRDLEVICLKCLEKDPRRRYASADAFGQDLQRFRAGEPITARAVGPVERTRLWVFRHPTTAALSVTSIVALIAMIAAGLFVTYNGELKRANRVIAESRAELQTAYASEASARRRAEAAEKIAAEQREVAVEAFDEARNALDLANTFFQAMQVTDEQLLAPPSLSFPADRFDFVVAMSRNQEIAARVAYTVEEILEPMVRGTKLTVFAAAVMARRGDISLEPMMSGNKVLDRKTSSNWQAHYDLVLGRLLSIKVRCYEYNWACARIKKDPPKFSNASFNAWRLVRDDNAEYSKEAAAVARESKLLLKRVVDEHPGSPWAFLAQRELSSPLGFRWVETYVNPAARKTATTPDTKAMARAVDIINSYNYQSCCGFLQPSFLSEYAFQCIRSELDGTPDAAKTGH